MDYQEGAIRLCEPVHHMVALSLISGRVEVYHGQWGTVCDNNWDINDATVACRQLGYGRAVFAPKGATFGRGSDLIHYDNMNCSGSEQHLADCPHSGISTNCWTHWHSNAGVVCEGKSGLTEVML